METHVASVKTDDGVWLCCSVVHKNFRFLYGVSGEKMFLEADFVQRDKNGAIDGT